MLRWSVAGLFFALGLLPVTAMAAVPSPSIPSVKAHKSLLLDVAVAGKRLVAAGERGHIVLSDDGGKTWRQAIVPTQALLTAVYFVDEKRGWVVGHDSVVLATQDAGESWVLQHYKEYRPDAHEDVVMDKSDDYADFEEGYEDDGRVIGSREGVPLLDVWFADAAHGLAVGAYGLMLRTSDGGKSWQDVSDSVANAEGWHFNAVAGEPGGVGVVLIAGEKGTLYRSTDGGQSFKPITSPYDGSFFGVITANDGAFYVFGLQGKVYRSVDRGGSWVRIATGISSGLNDACLSPSGQVFIPGNAGVVLSGSSGGAEFTTQVRPDRQAVLSCAVTDQGVVLVGEGGVKSHQSPPASP